ncbi:hypothetical protein RZS08_45700, partial [Arthrospira platensis SPKY1]|nr:hypothetical protein [Arthrospira platensis SPKY1]
MHLPDKQVGSRPVGWPAKAVWPTDTTNQPSEDRSCSPSYGRLVGGALTPTVQPTTHPSNLTAHPS